MKTTYEEREAQLRRDYGACILTLEQQLASTKTPEPSARRKSAQVASYVALCALADQAVGLPPHGQKKQSHPALEPFKSEQELVKYVTALYARLQTALQGAEMVTAPPHSTEKPKMPEADHAQASDNNSTKAAQQNKLPDSPARKLQRVHSAPATAASSAHDATRQAPNAETVCASRLNQVRLSAAQESNFKAIARKLLISGVLQSYVVHPDDEFDGSFRQMDLYSK